MPMPATLCFASQNQYVGCCADYIIQWHLTSEMPRNDVILPMSTYIAPLFLRLFWSTCSFALHTHSSDRAHVLPSLPTQAIKLRVNTLAAVSMVTRPCKYGLAQYTLPVSGADKKLTCIGNRITVLEGCVQNPSIHLLATSHMPCRWCCTTLSHMPCRWCSTTLPRVMTTSVQATRAPAV
jgi:hypothetical protein